MGGAHNTEVGGAHNDRAEVGGAPLTMKTVVDGVKCVLLGSKDSIFGIWSVYLLARRSVRVYFMYYPSDNR